MDPDYLGRDLGEHLISLGWNQKTIDDVTVNAKSKEKFREVVDEQLIELRKIWFHSFREGLTCTVKNKSKSICAICRFDFKKM